MLPTMHYKKNKIKENSSFNENLDLNLLKKYIKNSTKEHYVFLEHYKIEPQNTYKIIMEELEKPLIEATMEFFFQNQSKSAKALGINRGTFRKKLSYYGML